MNSWTALHREARKNDGKKDLFKLQKVYGRLNGGGAHLYSEHSGGRDRMISEFHASLVFIGNSRTFRPT